VLDHFVVIGRDASFSDNNHIDELNAGGMSTCLTAQHMAQLIAA
jgi:hypothetical protein